jgi:hypothetical protein
LNDHKPEPERVGAYCKDIVDNIINRNRDRKNLIDRAADQVLDRGAGPIHPVPDPAAVLDLDRDCETPPEAARKDEFLRFHFSRGCYLIPLDLVRTNKLSLGAKMFMINLMSYCFGKKLACYPSTKTLADDLNVSRRQIQRLKDECLKAGCLHEVQKGKGRTSTLYLNIEKKIET